MSIAEENANVTIDVMIRDLLLAMVSSQNEANKAFVAAINELAGTDLVISYKKNVGEKIENREIKGSALAFGIVPTLLNIQSGVIELKTAISLTKNTAVSKSAGSTRVRDKAGYLFRAQSIDAKYQNTYTYKAEASSIIKITVVPIPPSDSLMETIKTITETSPVSDKT
jgi:hypothetical protein